MDNHGMRSGVLNGFDELFCSHILVITGKGGVGKTTSAAAIAIAGAASGRRTLLVDVEGRQGLSQTFGTSPWDSEEREIRPGLWGIAIDPNAAVYDYLNRFYGLRRMQWLMEKSHALDFVTSAAPGLRDLLLIGKIYDLETRRRDDGQRRYELIVVDAPPTGRIVPFLRSPTSTIEIVRVGQIQRQATQIVDMLLNPRRLQVVITSLLEEMPITETIEGLRDIREIGIRTGPVIANRFVAPQLATEHLEALTALGPEALQRSISGAGATISRRTTELLTDIAATHVAQTQLQRDMLQRLTAQCRSPIIVLPQLGSVPPNASDIEVLAAILTRTLGEPTELAHERFADGELAAIHEASRAASCPSTQLAT